jgi:uncharacterized delta-60 repeat protein
VPSIEFQPRGQTVVEFQQAAFGVIASGTPPLTYQWFKDGNSISGATNDQIVLPRVDYADAGKYFVAISDRDGEVISEKIELLVNSPRLGDLDGTFLSGGAINNLVRAIALRPDGKILIGGDFETLNGATRKGIARLNPNGTTDHTFDGGGTPNYSFGPIIAAEENKVLLGHARLLQDGSRDLSYQIGSYIFPNAFAVQDNGKILVVRVFSPEGSPLDRAVHRLNSDGTRDATFQSPNFGLATFYSITPQRDGKIVVGGRFQIIGDSARTNIARLNSDGSVDVTFKSGISATEGIIRSIAIQDSGKILIGGDFKVNSGYPRNGIARLNSDGTLDTTFQSGLSAINGSVGSIALQLDGKVLVGGYFTQYGSAMRNYLLRLNADGTLDTRFLSGLSNGPNGSVHSIQVQPDGKILIGGEFNTVSGIARRGIARINSDGGVDGAFQNPIQGVFGKVHTIALQSNAAIVVAGDFTVDEGPVNRIVRFHRHGIRDTTFQDALKGFSELPSEMIVQEDDKLIVLLNSLSTGSSARFRVVRLDANGTLDSTFGNSMPGANATIRRAVVQADGKILVAGDFSSMHGVKRTRMARLNRDGSLDTSFADGFSEFPWVWGAKSIGLQYDGKILVAAEVAAQPTGPAIQGITRFKLDGSVDRDFQPVRIGGEIKCILNRRDGKIVIAGIFSVGDAAARGWNIARLHADGSLDSSFVGVDVDADIYLLAPDGNGRLLAAGFGTGLFRLNPDGSRDETFRAISESISAIVLQPDQNILIAGSFSTLHGVPTGQLARLWGDTEPPLSFKSVVNRMGSIIFEWHGLPNRTYRIEYKEDISQSTWQEMPDAVTPIDSSIFSDSTENRSRFYRVKIIK